MEKPFKEIPLGKGMKIKDGENIAILSIGHPGNFVIEAQENFKKEGLSIAHYNMIYVKPLDEKLLHEVFRKFGTIITIEDGSVMGGFGSAVLEFMAKNNYSAKVKLLGVPDKFINHGTQEELYNECYYNKDAIINSVHAMLKSSVTNQVG